MKPTDERLKELIEYQRSIAVYGGFEEADELNAPFLQRLQDERECLIELLFSRQTIKRLVEDGERLAGHLGACCIYVYPNDDDKRAIAQHTALMQELKEEG